MIKEIKCHINYLRKKTKRGGQDEDFENKPVSFLKKVLDVQTTAGYIINESMYDLFIDLYSWTLPFLKNTRKHWIYILDQIWKILQPIKKWYCFDIRIGKQRPFYIDNGNGKGKELFIPDY